jgi:hypothetical protein
MYSGVILNASASQLNPHFTKKQTDSKNRHLATMLKPATVKHSSSGANWDEQIANTFTQSFTSMAYNITAVAQVDSDGCGPAYLLNGLSDQGYWYQVGVSYDWDCGASGFMMAYEVFDSNGVSIFPSNGGGGSISFTGTVNAGNILLLNLFFGTGSYSGQVVMYSYDWNTGAYASETYDNEGASYFTGLSNGAANTNGFFTGLMTEQYHSTPYYGTEQFVGYSNQQFALTSAWQWIDEWNVVTNQSLFYSASNSPVSFDNFHQLHEFSSNGATEYADAYVLDTGADPVSISVSSNPTSVDAGIQANASLSAEASGGTAPYEFLIFLDNKLMLTDLSTNGSYSASINFGFLPAGSHTYYVDVVDSYGYPASSQSFTFQISSDPSITISSVSQSDAGRSFQLNYQVSGGRAPYNETLYVDGPITETEYYADVSTSGTNSVKLTNAGSYYISVQITDAFGYASSSNTLTMNVNQDPTTTVSVAKKTIDVGQSDTVMASLEGGSPSYNLLWYVNGQISAQGQTSNSSLDYIFNSTSPGNFTIFANLIDSADFSTNSTLQSFTVNEDPMLSWSTNSHSTDFFFSNNLVSANAIVSGGTGAYTYNWYLNGQLVSSGDTPTYKYSISSFGQNKLQLKVTDAAGFTVSSSTEIVNYGYNYVNFSIIAAVIAIVTFLGILFVLKRSHRIAVPVSS